MAPHIARHPGWFLGFVRDGMPLSMVNVPTSQAGLTALTAASVVRLTPPTWSDVAWARELWGGPVVIKGVVTGDDARRAVDSGADAIVVSNHGGRQLDGISSTIAALPEVADAVGMQVELLLDGGVRRGTDVLKAVSLGARAVLVGRPYVYGLAMAGEAGVGRVLGIFRDEMSRALMLSGYSQVSELGPDWVQSRQARIAALGERGPATRLPS
jgi:isopentenyl diphosphate isomerase/L-lactate dehydrogenase-like FMN-dependent dehydrogenase